MPNPLRAQPPEYSDRDQERLPIWHFTEFSKFTPVLGDQVVLCDVTYPLSNDPPDPTRGYGSLPHRPTVYRYQIIGSGDSRHLGFVPVGYWVDGRIVESAITDKVISLDTSSPSPWWKIARIADRSPGKISAERDRAWETARQPGVRERITDLTGQSRDRLTGELLRAGHPYLLDPSMTLQSLHLTAPLRDVPAGTTIHSETLQGLEFNDGYAQTLASGRLGVVTPDLRTTTFNARFETDRDLLRTLPGNETTLSQEEPITLLYPPDVPRILRLLQNCRAKLRQTRIDAEEIQNMMQHYEEELDKAEKLLRELIIPGLTRRLRATLRPMVHMRLEQLYSLAGEYSLLLWHYRHREKISPEKRREVASNPAAEYESLSEKNIYGTQEASLLPKASHARTSTRDALLPIIESAEAMDDLSESAA